MLYFIWNCSLALWADLYPQVLNHENTKENKNTKKSEMKRRLRKGYAIKEFLRGIQIRNALGFDAQAVEKMGGWASWRTVESLRLGGSLALPSMILAYTSNHRANSITNNADGIGDKIQ